MKIKAIIFDCDGTLVDSENAHFSAWQRLVKEHNKTWSLEEHIQVVGKPDICIAEIVAQKIESPHPNKILDKKKKYFEEHLKNGLPAIEGTVDFVHQLVKKRSKIGLKLGLASAAIKPDILANLKSINLDKAFDIILSGHDDLSEYNDPEGVNKPKPYIYLHAAKLLGVSSRECVVIEDSCTGVTAAVNAGCITVAIPNFYTQNHDLSKAHFTIKSLFNTSLEDFLQMINP